MKYNKMKQKYRFQFRDSHSARPEGTNEAPPLTFSSSEPDRSPANPMAYYKVRNR